MFIDVSRHPSLKMNNQSNNSKEPNKSKCKSKPNEAPSGEKCESSKNDSLPPVSISSPSHICLAPCHRFHTNPAVSSPKHIYQTPFPSYRINRANSILAINNPRAFKRKQRLMNKGQPGSFDTPLIPSQASTATNQNSTSIASDVKPPSSNGIDAACIVKWAPNMNFIKNVELVAIASPLTPGDNVNQHYVGPSSSKQNANSTPASSAVTLNNGSSVYVLVFDEGIFSHNGDFSLSAELCELFGLPTQNLLQQNENNNVSDQPNKSGTSEGIPNANRQKFGLRRQVFHDGPTIVEGDCNPLTNPTRQKTESTNNGDNTNEDKTNHHRLGSLEKLESSLTSLTNNIVKPLVSHVSHEIENAVHILKSEIISDGRIHNSDPVKGYAMSKSHLEEVTAELIDTSIKEQCPNFVDEMKNKSQSNNDTRIGGTSECPVKPTLVFRVNLPYSNTSMEIMNIEWNTDGTMLSIVQRRKGFSATGNVLGTNVTNKKKRANATTSPVSPGNTAVSFWCIPPWLQVDYDEMKLSYENEDEELCEDKLVIKSNNTCHDCGWEVEDNSDNRSLFPLWEWYLARYVFNDEEVAKESICELKTKIMMKNMMDQNAFAMELAISNTASNNLVRHGKKNTAKTNRTSSAVENMNSIMNGDVTCLIWENATPEDEIRLGPDAYKERMGNEKDIYYNENEGEKKKTLSANSNDMDKNEDCDSLNLPFPSKWVVVGTSKGQIILHNSFGSFLSNHTRKSKAKATGTNNAAQYLASMTSQSRTITVPVRHKKRVTCGAWVDNLLVVGNVGTGCLTLVSTFSNILQMTNDGNVSPVLKHKQEMLAPLFEEKNVKVLGNIMLPGGRDAVDIQIGNIKDELGSLTMLSVNCEGKCLLFYTFPKLIEDSGSASHSGITSSPAMELNFTIDSSAKGLDVMCHHIIPNTYLVVVAFTSGYFALVDWSDGSVLSDKDVSLHCQETPGTKPSMARGDEDNFLQHVAFHLPTCTAACLTKTGHIVIYHVRVRNKCHWVGSKKCRNAINCNSKKHTRPKTKSSTPQNIDHFIDRESTATNMAGTVHTLCTKKLNGPKAHRVNFSADGESVSVALGDESVSIFSIKDDEEETNEIKERLAQRIYLFNPFQLRLVFCTSVCFLIWHYYNYYLG